jgi:ion channel-forming bestrophin family protein
MIVRKYLSVRKIIYFTWKKVAYIALISTGVAIAHNYYHQTHLQVPIAAFGILGTALAILLGFRNNSAYDRWWEARRLWGTVINESRSLSRQYSTFFTMQHSKDGNEAELKSMIKEMTYRQIAFAYALSKHLRKNDVLKDLDPFLNAEEIEGLRKEKNIPNALIQKQAARLTYANKKGYIEDFRHMQIDTRMNSLCDALGGCERIKNTVFPRQYSFYTSVFTWIFITLLPFVIVPDLSYMTVPFSIIIGFIFFVLESIGYYIENPFENSINDIPMTSISRTIEINLRQQLGETELPEPVQPVEGFLY